MQHFTRTPWGNTQNLMVERIILHKLPQNGSKPTILIHFGQLNEDLTQFFSIFTAACLIAVVGFIWARGMNSIPRSWLGEDLCSRLQARAVDEFLVYRCFSAWFHERAKVPKQQGAGLGWAQKRCCQDVIKLSIKLRYGTWVT